MRVLRHLIPLFAAVALVGAVAPVNGARAQQYVETGNSGVTVDMSVLEGPGAGAPAPGAMAQPPFAVTPYPAVPGGSGLRLLMPGPRAPVSQLLVPRPGRKKPATRVARPAAPKLTPPPRKKKVAKAAPKLTPPPPPGKRKVAKAAPKLTPPPPPRKKKVVKVAPKLTPPPPPGKKTVARAAPKLTPPPKKKKVAKAKSAPKVITALSPPPPPVKPGAARKTPAKRAAKKTPKTKKKATPPAKKAPAVAAAPPPPKPAKRAAKRAAAKPTPAAKQQARLPPTGGKPTPGRALRVVFGAGAAKLPSGAQANLKKLAGSLKDDGTLRLQLLAYAGGKGLSPSKARRLSLSRALAVRSYLIESGVRSTRIDVRALGNKTTEEPVNRVDVNIAER